MTPDDISVLFSLFVHKIRNNMTRRIRMTDRSECIVLVVGGDTDTGIGSLSLSFNYTPLTSVEYSYNLKLIFIEGM